MAAALCGAIFALYSAMLRMEGGRPRMGLGAVAPREEVSRVNVVSEA